MGDKKSLLLLPFVEVWIRVFHLEQRRLRSRNRTLRRSMLHRKQPALKEVLSTSEMNSSSATRFVCERDNQPDLREQGKRAGRENPKIGPDIGELRGRQSH